MELLQLHYHNAQHLITSSIKIAELVSTFTQDNQVTLALSVFAIEP